MKLVRVSSNYIGRVPHSLLWVVSNRVDCSRNLDASHSKLCGTENGQMWTSADHNNPPATEFDCDLPEHRTRRREQTFMLMRM